MQLEGLYPVQAVEGWYWGTKAAVVYVSPDGNCLGSSPCYETLLAGIDAAGDAFSVNVKKGGYHEIRRGGNRQTLFHFAPVPLDGQRKKVVQANLEKLLEP